MRENAVQTCPDYYCMSHGEPLSGAQCPTCGGPLESFEPPAYAALKRHAAQGVREREIEARRRAWAKSTGTPITRREAPEPRKWANGETLWRSSEPTSTGSAPRRTPTRGAKGDTAWTYISTAGLGLVFLVLGIVDKVSWAPKADYCQLGAQFGATGGGCTLPRLLGPFADVFLILGIIALGGLALIVWVRKKS